MTDQADQPVEPAPTPRLAGPIIVVLTSVCMIVYVWDRGPDPVIDYGRELYVPWRITEGDVLYRHMRYFNGPLTPYVNAMLFQIFGVGLRTLQSFNAVLILATAVLSYRLVERVAGALAATAAGITFPVLFACAHFGFGGTFNWLTPYSTDLTFGVALGLAMIAWLGRSERHAGTARSIGWSAAAGLLFGLVLLTKVEVIVAAAAGATAALLGIVWQTEPARRGRALVAGAAFVGAAGLPPALATCLLTRHMSVEDALAGIFGAWRYVADERIRQLRLYRWVLGTEELGDNLTKLLGWTVAYAALVVASYALGRLVARRAPRVLTAASIIWAMLLLTTGIALWRQIPWNGALRPIPVLLIVAAAWLVIARLTGGRFGAALPTPRVALSLGLIAFAGVLLAKMLFNVRAVHYGFALVMPATMVAITVVVGWLPRRLGPTGAPVRASALALLALLLVTGVRLTAAWRARYTVPLGVGADRFLADRERGGVVRDLLADLHDIARRRPNATLMAVPEGLMINYLARLENPTGHQNLMPLEMVMYGEERMAADLAANPPDFIALVHADHSIHGVRSFGRDYGLRLDAWIRAHYRPVKLYGAVPFSGPELGMLLMERNSP